MIWIAPTEIDPATDTLETSLWAAAEQAAPAPHSTAQYSGGRPPGPHLGHIFLRFDFVPANPPFNAHAEDTAMRVSAHRQVIMKP